MGTKARGEERKGMFTRDERICGGVDVSESCISRWEGVGVEEVMEGNVRGALRRIGGGARSSLLVVEGTRILQAFDCISCYFAS